MLPHCAAEQFTLHVTPLFAVSLLTVAANCAVRPGGTLAVAGDTPTETTTGGAGADDEPMAHPPTNKTEQTRNGNSFFISHSATQKRSVGLGAEKMRGWNSCGWEA